MAFQYEKICRLCLNSNNTYIVNIFNGEYNIVEKINDLLSLEVNSRFCCCFTSENFPMDTKIFTEFSFNLLISFCVSGLSERFIPKCDLYR